ncbi:MAG: hypothetical protein HYS05_09825 [Acidobacteria bacterium]|nr:hypothetical protein [Acidobacteriota bacterium]
MVWLAVAVLAIPLGLDLCMPVPEDNPLTAEKIELGRRLFNDRRLSREGSISCSSCRDPGHVFAVTLHHVRPRESRSTTPRIVAR